MPIIAPETLTGSQPHHLLTSLFIPRPIAWVGTLGRSGVPNLAPFSFAAGVTSSPPVMMVSISTRRGQEKDTLRNIRETGEFTINIVSERLLQRMHQSSFAYGPDQSEFEQVGLALRPSQRIAAPGVADAPVTMELKLRHIIPVPGTDATMVLGDVLLFVIDDDVWDGTAVSAEKLAPVGRLGVDAYTVVRDVVRLPPAR